MPRVIKHPEIRRAEIIAEALRIFLERGYENTSLNELICEAGLSKGMFYHHFSCKEDLLRGLFELVAEQTYEQLRPVLEEPGVAPLQRLQNVLDRTAEIRLGQAELIRCVLGSFYRPESDILFQGIARAWVKRFAPVLGEIIRDGVASGLFQTFDPEGVAEMHLQNEMSIKELVHQGMTARSVTERDRVADIVAEKLRLYSLMLTRMLGIADGSLTIASREFAHHFFSLLNPLESAPTEEVRPGS